MPASPDPGPTPPPAGTRADAPIVRRRGPGALALQTVGALVGIGLAVWAVALAFGGENADAIERLRDASALAIAGLLGLTALHITLNGVLFYVTLRPLEGAGRASVLRVVMINTIPTLLAVLPFKLGFVARVGLHRRLDGLSFRTLGAWMGAFAVLTVATLAPAGAIGLFADGALWWALLVAAPMLGLGCVLIAARLAARSGPLRRLMLGSERALADPRTLAANYAIRMVDIGVQGARFALAASVVGITLEPQHAMLLGASYFLVVAIAPAGALGVAEIVTAGVATSVGLDQQAFALVALVVSASHYLGAFLLSIPSAVVLRPDRVFARQPAPSGPLPSG
ncbi:MAG: lysylphosphatidylglycerol synthase domain-containing protein [Planctomycetota bacterium]